MIILGILEDDREGVKRATRVVTPAAPITIKVEHQGFCTTNGIMYSISCRSREKKRNELETSFKEYADHGNSYIFSRIVLRNRGSQSCKDSSLQNTLESTRHASFLFFVFEWNLSEGQVNYKKAATRVSCMPRTIGS